MGTCIKRERCFDKDTLYKIGINNQQNNASFLIYNI